MASARPLLTRQLETLLLERFTALGGKKSAAPQNKHSQLSVSSRRKGLRWCHTFITEFNATMKRTKAPMWFKLGAETK